jgi:hypothetical protein
MKAPHIRRKEKYTTNSQFLLRFSIGKFPFPQSKQQVTELWQPILKNYSQISHKSKYIPTELLSPIKTTTYKVEFSPASHGPNPVNPFKERVYGIRELCLPASKRFRLSKSRHSTHQFYRTPVQTRNISRQNSISPAHRRLSQRHSTRRLCLKIMIPTLQKR